MWSAPKPMLQLDYGRVSVVERAPVVLPDEIASQHNLIPGPRRVGLGHYKTQPSKLRGHGGIATREVHGSKRLTVPHLVGDTHDGLGVVKATTVVEEVATGFPVAVLGQEFSPPEPVELLDGGEYVSGGDVWLGHERSVDKLLLRMNSPVPPTPLGTPNRGDPLTPRSTQPLLFPRSATSV
jgi:hypothetical protein